MSSADELLNQALDHHRQGRFADAEAAYRQVLRIEPNHPDALHLLGVMAYQLNRPEAAIELIAQAIRLHPGNPTFYSNLGEAYRKQGHCQQAIACYRHAIGLDPGFADAHYNLGNAYCDLAQWSDAAEAFRQALAIQPEHAGTHQNLAIAYHRQGLCSEAEVAYRQALALDPQCVETLNNLGTLYLENGQVPQAQKCYRQAIALRPLDANAWNLLGRALHAEHQPAEAQTCFRRALAIDANHADAYNNLGMVLFEEGRFEEAAASQRLSIALRPNSAAAHYNLGNALKSLNQLPEAAESYHRALALKPNHADTCNNLGTLLRYLGRPEEAIPLFERAIRIAPDNANAHLNLGTHRLLLGDFAQGWPEYEWRLKQADITPREFSQPRWQGESLAGRTILLWTEQGFGDTLQFIRYAALVKQRGATVIVQCPPELAGLLARSPGVDRCLALGEALPDFEIHASLASLPGIFGTTLETIPAAVPYVRADAQRIAAWQEFLADFPGFKVGLVWQGNPRFRKDRYRSIPLEQLRPLAELPGAQLFSLQMGPGRESLPRHAREMGIVDLAERLHDFDETAAALENLDLLISTDTSPAHLAGALNVPVWVPLGLAADWRWLLERDDSPWYPCMRLFRQRKLDDWSEVIARVRAALVEQLPATSP